MLRSILALMLLIPIACFGDVPESIIGRWQFDSVRTMTEYMDQVFEANPEVATPEQIQEQKARMAENSAQTDQQLTTTITEDTIGVVNTTSQETTDFSYRVVGGNSRLVVIDATTSDGDNFVINIQLVEGGIAMETLDCQSNPEPCERAQERQRQRAESATMTISGGLGEPPAHERPGPTQPQWIYFRPLPSISESE